MGIHGEFGGIAMQQFNLVRNVVHSSVAGICLVLLQSSDTLVQTAVTYFSKLVPFAAEHARVAAAGLLATVLLFLFKYSDQLAHVLIESIPVFSPALRRLLSRRNDIEGDWPLIVVDTSTKQVLYEGFLNVDFKNGELYVSGADWRPNGELAFRFRSIRSTFDKGVLRYFYEQGIDLTKPEMHGYAEIYFFPDDARAKRHAGEFLDKKNQSPMRFYAKRLKGGIFSKRIREADKRKAAAKAFRAEMEPRLPELLQQRFEVDWA